MRIEQHILSKFLQQFDGQPCLPPDSSLQKNSSRLFDQPLPFHATTSFDQDNYPDAGNHFSAFISYHLLQTMQHSFDFLSKRFINNEWFHFRQLPLILSYTDQEHSKKSFIENPTALSWPEFSKTLQEHRQHPAANTSNVYQIGHQIIVASSNVKGLIVSPDTQPQFVLSPRTNHQFALSLAFPRASCLPVAIGLFTSTLQHNMQNSLQFQHAHAM